jgi:hypothetical protein
VDGRGTGFMGRKSRVGIRGRLGELESYDQAAAAEYFLYTIHTNIKNMETKKLYKS